MKKNFLTFLLTVSMILSLSACGGSSNSDSSSEPEEKIYVQDDEIKDIFSSPDKYEGKYVQIFGKVFTDPEKDGDDYALQAWNNTQDAENDFVVYYTRNDDIKVDDYIVVDGKISGKFQGENVFGTEVTCPLIEADSIEIISYMDAVVPTTKQLTPNVSSEQHKLKITVDKIEFADIETRVYMTVLNDGKENASYGMYDIRIIQDGKQIEQDDSSNSPYEGNYPELSYDVTPGASTSGILVFPALDQTKDFQIVVPDVYSDNYELEFKDYTLDVKVE